MEEEAQRSQASEPIVSAVERAAPSVVNISTVRAIRDEFLHVHPVAGLGSGIIVSDHGYIVTNRHVVAGAGQLVVTFHDGRKREGRVAGMDRTTDLAVVKVDASALTASRFGDSDALRVGEQVIAIGNPFGFILGGPTVTVGYVSALHRQIATEDQIFEDLVQTDAAINPGNSGGPLVNLDARVVGVNSAAIPFAQGIGFAIPANVARRVAEEVIQHGRVIRPWLGLVGAGVSEEDARYYGLPARRGVLVVGVVPKGPADRVGIERGDMITSIDGRALREGMKEFMTALQSHKPGDTIGLHVFRDRVERDIRVTLAEAPSE